MSKCKKKDGRQKYKYIIEMLKMLDYILKVQATTGKLKQSKDKKRLVMGADNSQTFNMIYTQTREAKRL